MDDLCPNKNLHDNLKIYLEELDSILPKFAFKKIGKLLTEKALNIIKDKIKLTFSEITNDLHKQGLQVPTYSKKDDENCLFKAAVGKYVKGKKIPVAIQ